MDPASLVLTGIGQGITGAYINHQNIKFQRDENQKNRQFTLESEARNRQWATEDWERNNSYNSPAQQMQRLREAGLNPHLVYGKGADNTAAMVRSSSANQSNQQAPKIDASLFPRATDLVMGFASLQKQQAETDNLHKTNALIQAQARAADAAALKALADAKGSENKNWLFTQTKNNLIDNILLETQQKKLGLGYTQMLTDVGYNDYKLREAKNPYEIAKIWQDIEESKGRMDVQRSTIQRNTALNKLTSAQEAHTWQDMTLQDRKLQLLTSETWIKSAEAVLAKKGIFKSDPIYHREMEKYAAEIALRQGASMLPFLGGKKTPMYRRKTF